MPLGSTPLPPPPPPPPASLRRQHDCFVCFTHSPLRAPSQVVKAKRSAHTGRTWCSTPWEGDREEGWADGRGGERERERRVTTIYEGNVNYHISNKALHHKRVHHTQQQYVWHVCSANAFKKGIQRTCQKPTQHTGQHLSLSVSFCLSLTLREQHHHTVCQGRHVAAFPPEQLHPKSPPILAFPMRVTVVQRGDQEV